MRQHEGWAVFRFERQGVPADVLAYAGTVLASGPDRLAVFLDRRRLWCKSVDFFYRHSSPGHPRRRLIEDFWAKGGAWACTAARNRVNPQKLHAVG